MMGIERRHTERRRTHHDHRLGDRGMRCHGCGTVWYSAVASTVVRWGRCIRCDGALHVERRSGGERRHANTAAAA